MIYTIDEIKEKAIPIAIKYGVDSLAIFGSYARNEATSKSDIDFFVEKGELRTLFQMGAMQLDLEEALGQNVDLITLSGIKNKEFCDEIINESIKLYEKQQKK